jgi:hypothetical protein
LEESLGEETIRLREYANELPQGIEREHLLRKARQCETGSHMRRLAAFARFAAAEIACIASSKPAWAYRSERRKPIALVVLFLCFVAKPAASMPHSRHNLAVVDVRGLWVPLREAPQADPAPCGRVRDRPTVVSRHVRLELGDGCAAGWHRDRLDAFERSRGHAAEIVDLVEDLADDMEG